MTPEKVTELRALVREWKVPEDDGLGSPFDTAMAVLDRVFTSRAWSYQVQIYPLNQQPALWLAGLADFWGHHQWDDWGAAGETPSEALACLLLNVLREVCSECKLVTADEGHDPTCSRYEAWLADAERVEVAQ